jgi:hypothetical protein
MTRNHRRWHAWGWFILGPLITLGFVVGLLARPKQESGVRSQESGLHRTADVVAYPPLTPDS